MTDATFLFALAGAILGAASIVLHVVAPRTKTTIDDELRDDIDEALAFWRGQRDQQVTKVDSPAAARLVPPAAAMLLLVVLGGAMLGACGAGQVVTDTGGKIVDCTKQDAGQIAAVAAHLAGAALAYELAGTPIDWGAIEAQAEAAGLAIGGCALGPLVAARGPSSSSTAPALAAAATPPANDAARAWAAFARLKAHAGVATFQTSAGPL